MGESGASSHITHKKRDTTDVEKYEINVTVGNFHKTKCKLKNSVNMKLKDGQTVKLNKVLYMPQYMKNILSISRLVSKGTTMGDTRDKMIIKKNSISMILDARKGQNKSTILYLKAKRYAP